MLKKFPHIYHMIYVFFSPFVCLFVFLYPKTIWPNKTLVYTFIIIIIIIVIIIAL